MKRILTLIITLLAIAVGANADNRTVISLVEATSTDYATIAVLGASVEPHPTIQITTGAPANFMTYMGGWYKKTGADFDFKVDKGLFTEGTWYYRCMLRVDGNAGNTHRFSENIVVKINGKTCKITDLTIEDTYSYCYVDWPEVSITGKLDDRTEVSLIEATSSDYMTTPKVGTSVTTKPTVSITKGTQARFDIASGYWAWKDQSGDFMILSSGGFNEGTYCYFCDIWIDGTAGKSYRLSDNLVVKLNGIECKVNGPVIVDNDYSRVHIKLLEISVKKQGNHMAISLVEGTSNQDWRTIPKVGGAVTKPTITVTTGAPAFFNINNYNGWWQKKVDGKWETVRDGNFTEGTWHFSCQVRIDSSSDPDNQYALDENVSVKVNGEEWEKEKVQILSNYSYVFVSSPEITIDVVREGTLGSQGMWRFKDGVLTVYYNGQMPQDCTSKTTDPEVAYRLHWMDFLSEIEEVVITGTNVEVQPYFLYYSGDGDRGQHPDDHIKKLTLGSGVKKVGKQAFASYDLKDVYCYGIEPPELSSDTGGSNVFWKKRIQENNAFLHLVKGASTGYAMINSEWAYFNHSATFLDPEDDPDYGNNKEGDLNGDSKVDIADAVTVLNIMAAGEYNAEADVNGDKKVDIADFVTVLNIMAAQ